MHYAIPNKEFVVKLVKTPNLEDTGEHLPRSDAVQEEMRVHHPLSSVLFYREMDHSLIYRSGYEKDERIHEQLGSFRYVYA